LNADDIWHNHRNPVTPSYGISKVINVRYDCHKTAFVFPPRTVPTSALWPIVFVIPITIFFIHFFITHDRSNLRQSLLGFTLATSLNGVLTNLIKITVGRPRPDFFYRCFPDGVMNTEMRCNGDAAQVIDGRKSFPSGHSSFAFVSMGFLAWYLMAKLHIFNDRGRANSARLLVCLCPLMVALLIAISRTADYHHHWQDVTVGSMLGLALSFLCYRQYYPSLGSKNPHIPYYITHSAGSVEPMAVSKAASPKHRDANVDANSLMKEEKDIKWI
jgi:diacylglycerol diphosphate phosphatase / phosphatidate phosphatase